MANLRQARGLGAAGSILILTGAIPNAGLLSLIVGLLLVLVAVKYIGEVVKNKEVYGDMATAVGVTLLAAVIGSLYVFSQISSFITSNPITTGPDLFSSFYNLISRIILGLVAVWLLLLVSSALVKKVYDSIANDLDESLFAMAGTLFVVGAALTIVFGIGLILVFIASVVQLAAFMSLPDEKRAIERKSPITYSSLRGTT